MKIFLCIFLCFCSFVSWGVDVSMQNQMLDSQLDKLTQERDKKRIELNKCKKQLTGRKVAGAATLATTGVGLYVNIKLNAKINEMGGADLSPGMPTDNRTQEQKNCDSCTMFIQAGLAPLPNECAGCA